MTGASESLPYFWRNARLNSGAMTQSGLEPMAFAAFVELLKREGDLGDDLGGWSPRSVSAVGVQGGAGFW